MAELHVIGEIVGGSGFSSRGLFCRWGAVSGRNWDLLEGIDQGQTHIDYPEDDGGDKILYSTNLSK